MTEDFKTEDYTTSATTSHRFNVVRVGVAGSLHIVDANGNVNILSAVPAGGWTPVGRAVRILPASTATGIQIATF